MEPTGHEFFVPTRTHSGKAILVVQMVSIGKLSSRAVDWWLFCVKSYENMFKNRNRNTPRRVRAGTKKFHPVGFLT
jgi:hypothetical protein